MLKDGAARIPISIIVVLLMALSTTGVSAMAFSPFAQAQGDGKGEVLLDENFDGQGAGQPPEGWTTVGVSEEASFTVEKDGFNHNEGGMAQVNYPGSGTPFAAYHGFSAKDNQLSAQVCLFPETELGGTGEITVAITEPPSQGYSGPGDLLGIVTNFKADGSIYSSDGGSEKKVGTWKPKTVYVVEYNIKKPDSKKAGAITSYDISVNGKSTSGLSIKPGEHALDIRLGAVLVGCRAAVETRVDFDDVKVTSEAAFGKPEIKLQCEPQQLKPDGKCAIQAEVSGTVGGRTETLPNTPWKYTYTVTDPAGKEHTFPKSEWATPTTAENKAIATYKFPQAVFPDAFEAKSPLEEGDYKVRFTAAGDWPWGDLNAESNFTVKKEVTEPEEGELIAFIRDGQVWKKNLQTGSETQLTNEGQNFFPVWSYTTDKIAFVRHVPKEGNTRDESICLMDIDGSNLKVLTRKENVQYQVEWEKSFAFPTFGPNDKKVYFSPHPYQQLASSIFSVDVKNEDQEPEVVFQGVQTEQSVDGYVAPDCSRENKKLAFWHAWMKGGIYGESLAVGPPGGEVNDIINDLRGFIWPKWSPDGKQIAYLKYGELYLTDSNGEAARKLEGIAGCNVLSWSADGGRLALDTGFSETPYIVTYDMYNCAVTPLVENAQQPAFNPKYRKKTGTVTGIVFKDTPVDGRPNEVHEPGEPGVPGVKVELIPVGSGENYEVETDGNGMFRFDDVEPGTYRGWIDENPPGMRRVLSADVYKEKFELEAGEVKPLNFPMEEVNVRKLAVRVEIPRTIHPGMSVDVKVKVTDAMIGAVSVGDALISASTDQGELVPSRIVTDGNGEAQLSYTAPAELPQETNFILLNFHADKEGYQSIEHQEKIVVGKNPIEISDIELKPPEPKEGDAPSVSAKIVHHMNVNFGAFVIYRKADSDNLGALRMNPVGTKDVYQSDNFPKLKKGDSYFYFILVMDTDRQKAMSDQHGFSTGGGNGPTKKVKVTHEDLTGDGTKDIRLENEHVWVQVNGEGQGSFISSGGPAGGGSVLGPLGSWGMSQGSYFQFKSLDKLEVVSADGASAPSLTNSSLEEGGATWTTGEGAGDWDVDKDSTGNCFAYWDDTEAHTGSRSAKLLMRYWGGDIHRYLPCSIPAGKEITLKAWVKMPHEGTGSNKWFTLFLHAYDANGEVVGVAKHDQKEPLPDWTEITVKLKPDADVSQLRVWACTQNGNGSYQGHDKALWVDDFSLEVESGNQVKEKDIGAYRVVATRESEQGTIQYSNAVVLGADKDYVVVKSDFTNTGSTAFTYDEAPGHIHRGIIYTSLMPVTDTNAFMEGVGDIVLSQTPRWTTYPPSQERPFVTFHEGGPAATFGFIQPWSTPPNQWVTSGPMMSERIDATVGPNTYNPGDQSTWRTMLGFHDGTPEKDRTQYLDAVASIDPLLQQAGINGGPVPPPDKGTIKGTVFLDSNGDGKVDEGETGVGGCEVKLLDSKGMQLNAVTSDGSGAYGFSELEPAEYGVQLGSLPPGVSPVDTSPHSVTVEEGKEAVVDLAVKAGAGKQLTIIGQDEYVVATGQTLDIYCEVAEADSLMRVEGVTVSSQVQAGNISPGQVTTGADGSAKFSYTAPDTEGRFDLTFNASIDGYDPAAATFSINVKKVQNVKVLSIAVDDDNPGENQDVTLTAVIKAHNVSGYSVWAVYQVNGRDGQQEMRGSGDRYSTKLRGQPAGTEVAYWVEVRKGGEVLAASQSGAYVVRYPDFGFKVEPEIDVFPRAEERTFTLTITEEEGSSTPVEDPFLHLRVVKHGQQLSGFVVGHTPGETLPDIETSINTERSKENERPKCVGPGKYEFTIFYGADKPADYCEVRATVRKGDRKTEKKTIMLLHCEGDVVQPEITEVRMNPSTPMADQDTSITANIDDSSGIKNCKLFYNPGDAGWSSTEMKRTAGSLTNYTGVIPGKPANTEVRYRIEATDKKGMKATYSGSYTVGQYQEEKASIRGRAILYEDGQERPMKNVVIRCKKGNNWLPTTTDAGGNYSFQDLPLGTYVVKIHVPPGYHCRTPSIVTVNASSPEDYNVNFELEPDVGQKSDMYIHITQSQHGLSGNSGEVVLGYPNMMTVLVTSDPFGSNPLEGVHLKISTEGANTHLNHQDIDVLERTTGPNGRWTFYLTPKEQGDLTLTVKGQKEDYNDNEVVTPLTIVETPSVSPTVDSLILKEISSDDDGTIRYDLQAKVIMGSYDINQVKAVFYSPTGSIINEEILTTSGNPETGALYKIENPVVAGPDVSRIACSLKIVDSSVTIFSYPQGDISECYVWYMGWLGRKDSDAIREKYFNVQELPEGYLIQPSEYQSVSVDGTEYIAVPVVKCDEENLLEQSSWWVFNKDGKIISEETSQLENPEAFVNTITHKAAVTAEVSRLVTECGGEEQFLQKLRDIRNEYSDWIKRIDNDEYLENMLGAFECITAFSVVGLGFLATLVVTVVPVPGARLLAVGLAIHTLASLADITLSLYRVDSRDRSVEKHKDEVAVYMEGLEGFEGVEEWPEHLREDLVKPGVRAKLELERTRLSEAMIILDERIVSEEPPGTLTHEDASKVFNAYLFGITSGPAYVKFLEAVHRDIYVPKEIMIRLRDSIFVFFQDGWEALNDGEDLDDEFVILLKNMRSQASTYHDFTGRVQSAAMDLQKEVQDLYSTSTQILDADSLEEIQKRPKIGKVILDPMAQGESSVKVKPGATINVTLEIGNSEPARDVYIGNTLLRTKNSLENDFIDLSMDNPRRHIPIMDESGRISITYPLQIPHDISPGNYDFIFRLWGGMEEGMMTDLIDTYQYFGGPLEIMED